MTTVTVLNGEPPTLERAQAIVGGYVELVTLADGSQLLINEEGRLKGLELNPTASALYGGLIVGNVLLLQSTARWT